MIHFQSLWELSQSGYLISGKYDIFKTHCALGSMLFFAKRLHPSWSKDNACGSGVKNAACRVLALYEAGQIWLKPDHFNSAGNNPYDGASSLSNIKDTCYGHRAKRSSYGSTTIGGDVCLSEKVKNIQFLTIRFAIYILFRCWLLWLIMLNHFIATTIRQSR